MVVPLVAFQIQVDTLVEVRNEYSDELLILYEMVVEAVQIGEILGQNRIRKDYNYSSCSSLSCISSIFSFYDISYQSRAFSLVNLYHILDILLF